MNFEEETPRWPTFAGDNFTERQRIKRKAGRWTRNFAVLPTDEHLALSSALLEREEKLG